MQTINEPKSFDTLLKISLLLLVASAGFVLFKLTTEGHASFNTANLGVTWGLPVSTYLFFVLTSTGLTFVASLSMVFGNEAFYVVAKRCVWLAVATLVSGFISLALEIGHPFRLLWSVPTGFQYHSPMFWMGALYSLYMVLLLLKFAKINGGDWHSSGSHRLGVASFVSVVIAHGTLGLVFGMMVMRPMWYDAMLPIYFLATAALSGGAFAVFFTYMAFGFSQERMPDKLRALASGALPKVFATVIGLVILITVSRTVTGLWSNQDGLQVYSTLLSSPMFHLELWLGLVVPFVLMLSPTLRGQASKQILSASLVIVGLFFGRLDFLVSGQEVPMFKGSWVHGLNQYTPSITEWAIAAMAFMMTLTLYALGEKLFNLSDTPAAD